MVIYRFSPLAHPLKYIATHLFSFIAVMQILYMTNDQLSQAHTLAATHTTDNSWNSCSSQAMTAVIGHFGQPVNCAVASPDGKHVAVVGDTPRACVVSAKHGYEWLPGKSRTFGFGAKMPMRSRSDANSWGRVTPGRSVHQVVRKMKICLHTCWPIRLSVRPSVCLSACLHDLTQHCSRAG